MWPRKSAAPPCRALTTSAVKTPQPFISRADSESRLAVIVRTNFLNVLTAEQDAVGKLPKALREASTDPTDMEQRMSQGSALLKEERQKVVAQLDQLEAEIANAPARIHFFK